MNPTVSDVELSDGAQSSSVRSECEQPASSGRAGSKLQSIQSAESVHRHVSVEDDPQ